VKKRKKGREGGRRRREGGRENAPIYVHTTLPPS